MAIFLKFGQPYIDITAEDNEGQDALTALLECVRIDWSSRSGLFDLAEYSPGVLRKIAILIRYGANPRSQNRNGKSCLRLCLGWPHPGKRGKDLYRERLECLCLLINNGADVHAISFDWSVTETAHDFRSGQLWEEALESCNLDVIKVYALDHNRHLKKSSDLYAPTDQRPRVRGPMDIQAYHDKCRKGLQRCATTHRIHEQFLRFNRLPYLWTGKCRWPNGMINDEHESWDEAPDESSSEQEEDNRARTASDCSEYNSETEDGSDEEIGGVPI